MYVLHHSLINQLVNLLVYQYIHITVNESSYYSVKESVYQSVHLSVNQFICQLSFSHLPFSQFIYEGICQSIIVSTDQSLYLSVYLSVYEPAYISVSQIISPLVSQLVSTDLYWFTVYILILYVKDLYIIFYSKNMKIHISFIKHTQWNVMEQLFFLSKKSWQRRGKREMILITMINVIIRFILMIMIN